MSSGRAMACTLWMIACMGLGFWTGKSLKTRLEVLESFERFFSFLYHNLVSLCMTLPEACDHFRLHEQGVAAEFARVWAEELRGGNVSDAQMTKLLNETVEKSDVNLTQGQRRALQGLSSCLWAQSDQDLVHRIELCRVDLQRELVDCRRDCETKTRLYRTLGFMAGALAWVWGM